MNKLPHATWLMAFEAAARHGSFSRAAEELNLTPAAISQQIKLLEEKLNTQLFTRMPRGVELTDIGQAYAQPLRNSFSEISALTNNLFATGVKHIIKVRSSISYAALVLAPSLKKFSAKYPNIVIQLSTSVWADRMDNELIDVDIRYGYGDWGDGKTYHLGHDYATIYCSPDYAARFNQAITFETLAKAQIVQIMGHEFEWKRLSNYHSFEMPNQNDWIKADSSLIALQTIIAGSGATIVLECFAKHYLAQGLLVKPLNILLPMRESHFMVVNKESEKKYEVNVFKEWVISNLINLPQAS